MELLQKIILILTIISVSTTLAQQRRRVKANPLASMLKNILSPSKTEGAMQLLKQATAGVKNCGGNPYLPEEFIVPAGMPQPYPRGYMAPKGYPNIPVARNPPLFEVAPVIEAIQPIIELPRGYPNLPVTRNPPLMGVAPVIETIQPVIEVPRGYPKLPVGPVQYQNVPVQNCGLAPYQPVPVPSCGCQPVVQEKPPCNQVTPAPLVNPFLPAASPVSAMAPPTSSMLPPADVTQCRCNFLRKIPIPPPTL